MCIADVMTRRVQCVSPDQSLEEAARMMADYDVGALPVVRDDEPVGMITDRDIAVRGIAGGRDPHSTPVSEMMTPDVICCNVEDSIEDAATAMEKHQVRRLMVMDEEGCICGIVSLGDLALRASDDELVEEVLEEVSWPGHNLSGGRKMKFLHRRPKSKRQARQVVTNAAIPAAAFAAGLAAMYALDPERGRRRRAVVRDKVVHAVKLTRDRLGKTARYTKGKTSGLLSETRSMLRRDQVSDEQLRERVRSALGRVVSHPHSIHVECQSGVINLSGAILANEVDQLVAAVMKVRGVRQVRNQLQTHETRGTIPSLQGGVGRRGRRAAVMQENWSPSTRLLGLIGGGALMAMGAARRDAISLAGAAAGLALATRSFTNLPARRLVGIGAGRRAVDVQKDININAPVEQVFDFFSKYRNFPHFMSRVKEVRDHGNGRSHWVVKGPAGMTVNWDADVTIFQPNETIAWRSVPGSMVDNAGVIRFEPNEKGGTRVNIKLSYNPPGGALGHAMAMLFGADAKSELDADLLRVKTLIETGHPAHDASQPAWAGAARR